MLKIVNKAQNLTTKKSSSSFATHQQPARPFSMATMKPTTATPFLLKSLPKMTLLASNKLHGSSMRTFCTDEFSSNSFGETRSFQRRPREGFQKRPPREASHIIVVRGLGESKETEAEVKRIFPGADIVSDGVTVLKDSRGKSLNTVFVEFSTVEEATKALELFRETTKAAPRGTDGPQVTARFSPTEEREKAVASASTPSPYVIVKRLPYSATEEEVKAIFAGLNVEGASVGNGNAIVKFATADDAARALEKNGAEFARRQVVVAPAIEMDYQYSQARPPKIIRVRGAPSSATEADFRKFFDGLEITRFNATQREGIAGRIVPGDVFIEFATPEDAARALKMDRQNMGDRYLQIYKSAVRERINRTNPNNTRGTKPFGGFGNQNFGEEQQ